MFYTRLPCDRGSIAILTIGRPVGVALDPLVRWEYMRDPKGEARALGWLRGNARWNGHAKLPADARSTGWSNGNVEIWTSASEHDAAIYVKRGDVVERWPRAADSWGVTDCNCLRRDHVPQREGTNRYPRPRTVSMEADRSPSFRRIDATTASITLLPPS